jgi:hypothetical protein
MAQFKYKSTYPNDIQDVTLSKYNSELSNIGFKYGTDKCWVNANHKNYLYHMEEFMKKNRYEEINLLEIGVRDGPGVKTFEEYFSNCNHIIGVDINPQCKKHEKGKIKIIIGDINNENTHIAINNIMTDEKFDYILDDGSHDMNDITKTFKYFWSKLKAGGWYIIEDLNNPYKKNQIHMFEKFCLSIIHMLNNTQNIDYDEFKITPMLLCIRKIK